MYSRLFISLIILNILLQCLLLCHLNAQSSPVPFIINEQLIIDNDTTWNSDTILIYDNVSVSPGVLLTISKGVYIEFQGHYSFTVFGRLNIYGSADEKVRFTVNDTTGFSLRQSPQGAWQGIRFRGGTGPSVMQHAVIEYAKATDQPLSGNGGGIYIETYNNLEISNCIIRNNYARIGGGIFCDNSNAVISHNLIHSNISEDGGGGIFIHNSELKIINNIIYNNISSRGGGVFFQNAADPVLVNNTIINNSAGESGGGIYFHLGSDPEISNTIIYGNQAETGGKQLHIPSGLIPSFYYCDIEGGEVELTKDPEVEYPGIAENIIDVMPDFRLDHPFDFSLRDTSGCIDAGNNSYVEHKLDFINNLRIWDGDMNDTATVDIGAYEYGAPPGLQVTYQAQDVTVQGAANGKLVLNITGGIHPYHLSLSGLYTSKYFTDVDTGDFVIDKLYTGRYDLTVWDNNGYSYSTEIDINFSGTVDFSISGNVFTKHGLLNEGVVIAFLKMENYYKPVDIVEVYNGEYLFENIDSAEYILYAIPNFINTPNYMPTFFANTSTWDQSNIVEAYGNTYGVDIYLENIAPKSIHDGRITGNIIYEDSLSYEPDIYKISWFDKDPDSLINPDNSGENITIILFNGGQAIAWTLSDKNGNFHFSNLPYDTYSLMVIKPGLEMYNVPSLTINEESNTFDDIKVFIRSSDIFISIEQEKTDWDVQIGPNPVRDILNINFNHYNELPFRIKITDMKGREISNRLYVKPSAITNLEIRMDDLISGVYYCGIEASSYRYAFKIIKY